MKLYICEDVESAKRQSREFAEMCVRDYTGEKKAQFIFTKNKYGKPFIKNRDIYFSLSHSGNLLICAVSRYNIGADCQIINIKDIERCKKIAARFYSSHENIFLNSLPEAKYINHFFKIWTKKEAYIKYTGKGLAEGLSTFSVNHLDGVRFIKYTGISGAYIYLCCGEDNSDDLRVEYIQK